MSELPKRKNLRIKQYDYATPGAYFITICTDHKKRLLWDNVGEAISLPPHKLPLSPIGKIVDCGIQQIHAHYPHISVDIYCIMPDHVHILLTIHADENGRQIAAPTSIAAIGQMKRWVSRQLGFSIWQKSCIDRIVRNDRGYDNVWKYIENNPLKPDFADSPIPFEEM